MLFFFKWNFLRVLNGRMCCSIITFNQVFGSYIIITIHIFRTLEVMRNQGYVIFELGISIYFMLFLERIRNKCF